MPRCGATFDENRASADARAAIDQPRVLRSPLRTAAPHFPVLFSEERVSGSLRQADDRLPRSSSAFP